MRTVHNGYIWRDGGNLLRLCANLVRFLNQFLVFDIVNTENETHLENTVQENDFFTFTY